jgi:uncharacterized protein
MVRGKRASTSRPDTKSEAAPRSQAKSKAAPPSKARRMVLPLAPSREPLPTGSFAAWLRATRSAREAQHDVEVPCGACNACCRSSLFIHIAPDERDTLQHIDPALLFPAPGAPPGHVLMGYDRQGRCPMLSESGCSIYEHRPRTCRDFDCRTVAATGLALDEAQRAIAEQARRWRFEHPQQEDDRQHAAVRAAAAFLSERGPELLPEALPSHPLQLAWLALRLYEVFYALAEGAGAARPSDAELARAVSTEMARKSNEKRAPQPTYRATSVKRASPTRS